LRAESDRLLYVAATRARDLLVVSRVGGAVRHPAWGAFAPFLRDAAPLPIPETVTLAPAAVVDLSARAAATDLAAAAQSHAQSRRASWTVTSVTAEAKQLPRVTPGTAADEARADDPTVVVVTETASRRADAGVAWGSLVHGLLEHAMRHQTATRGDLRRLALWLTVEDPSLRPLIEHALDTVEVVARERFWRTARAASECHEEAPFAIRDSDGAAPAVLTGTIDVAYRDGHIWRIVDYKTDADGDAADLGARHRRQLALYERAWSALAGASAEAAIILARRGPGSWGQE
jgi:ATP-dependent helicase/nuclease subunit A